MTYENTIRYLFNRLPSYSRIGPAAYKKDIGNISIASKKLGNPHKKFKSIHIAGTNGKGSTCHMIASALQEAGYNVGLYTSPHLKDLRERIKINGKMISKMAVIQFVKKNKTAFEQIDLSFFEFVVALAFNHFANKKVDIAIIETGLGGRLDSTNIIKPDLSIITNISMDHTNLLGNTIEEIAIEKAGIIKKETPIIIGRKQKEIKYIFKEIAKKNNAPIIYSNMQKYDSDLQGQYQIENINTVVTSLLELRKKGWRITKENIKNGLLNTTKNTGLLGRWHTLNKKPLTICDIGHNEEGINSILKNIRKIKYKNLHIVLGITDDKDIHKILNILPKSATYYFCKPNVPRGMSAKLLKKKAANYLLKGSSFISVKKAFKQAKQEANIADLIFIGGSTFVVSEVL